MSRCTSNLVHQLLLIVLFGSLSCAELPKPHVSGEKAGVSLSSLFPGTALEGVVEYLIARTGFVPDGVTSLDDPLVKRMKRRAVFYWSNMSSSNAWFWTGYLSERPMLVRGQRVIVAPEGTPFVFQSSKNLEDQLSKILSWNHVDARLDRFLEDISRSQRVSLIVSPLVAQSADWTRPVSVSPGQKSVLDVLASTLKSTALDFSVVNESILIHRSDETVEKQEKAR